MDIQITPRKLAGAVTPPPSKSMMHRAVLAQTLSERPGTIFNMDDSQDIQATQRCVAALKNAAPGNLPLLDCGESGSTLRFLIPIALALHGGARFTGRGRLMSRPQTPYFDIFREKAIAYDLTDDSLTVQGTLLPGVYALPGDVSSQFVTGLLYALPLLDGDSEIRITTPLQSRGYVDMTLDTLARFGIQAENCDYAVFRIPGGQQYRGCDIRIESDWSQAGFWYAAIALGNSVTIENLNAFSVQGDMVIAAYALRLAQPGDLEIDVSDCPDLLPPLAVMAAVRSGSTRFTGAARLRLKESDRLSTTSAMLRALGGNAEEFADELLVHGRSALSGGTVDGANDHHIVMAAAIAATACTAPVTILGAEAINKSYPTFWKVYETLGGEIHVL